MTDAPIYLPPSKSQAIRAIIAAVMACETAPSVLDFGNTDVFRSGPLAGGKIQICEDIASAMESALPLGAQLFWDGKRLKITAGKKEPEQIIFCGESALLFRTMLCAAPAMRYPSPAVVQRCGSLLRRPVEDLIDALQKNGASVQKLDAEGSKISVRGKLRSGTYEVDCSSTSQNATGFLFALCKTPGKSSLFVRGKASLPYVEMTADVLRRFGASITESKNGSETVFNICGGLLHPASIDIEPDWSAAAFFLVLMAAGRAKKTKFLKGIFPDSIQGDALILDFLEQSGCAPLFQRNSVSLNLRAHPLRAIEADLSGTPDLFPPLAVLTLFCRGTSRLSGISRTRAKECDRPAAMMALLSAMGARASIRDDSMEITGVGDDIAKLHGASVDSRGDHRIAMAAAIAGEAARVPVKILGAKAAISKSFPLFFETLRQFSGEE